MAPPIPTDADAIRLPGRLALHPPTTPPLGLLPNMSESSGTPGHPNGSGFSVCVALCRNISPSEPGSRLITLPQFDCRGSGVLRGLGTSIETDNLLVLGAGPPD
jgi:hypothetical protein